MHVSPHPVWDFVVCFRGSGWRHPLRQGDEIEVFTKGTELVVTLDARLIAALIAHHLDGLAMQSALKREIDAAHKPPAVAPPRNVVFPSDVREKFRAQRRARKR